MSTGQKAEKGKKGFEMCWKLKRETLLCTLILRRISEFPSPQEIRKKQIRSGIGAVRSQAQVAGISDNLLILKRVRIISTNLSTLMAPWLRMKAASTPPPHAPTKGTD